MKGKQQELTAKHEETTKWRRKDKAFPSSSHELFTSLHGLAPCISEKENIPEISGNCKDFLECFRMYLDEKVVQK